MQEFLQHPTLGMRKVICIAPAVHKSMQAPPHPEPDPPCHKGGPTTGRGRETRDRPIPAPVLCGRGVGDARQPPSKGVGGWDGDAVGREERHGNGWGLSSTSEVSVMWEQAQRTTVMTCDETLRHTHRHSLPSDMWPLPAARVCVSFVPKTAEVKQSRDVGTRAWVRNRIGPTDEMHRVYGAKPVENNCKTMKSKISMPHPEVTVKRFRRRRGTIFRNCGAQMEERGESCVWTRPPHPRRAGTSIAGPPHPPVMRPESHENSVSHALAV